MALFECRRVVHSVRQKIPLADITMIADVHMYKEACKIV